MGIVFYFNDRNGDIRLEVENNVRSFTLTTVSLVTLDDESTIRERNLFSNLRVEIPSRLDECG